MNIKEIAEWDRLWDYPLTEDSLVIDVGGYRGDWSWELRRRVQCGLIIFEPIKEFYQHCVERFRSQHDVMIINAGLSNKNERVELSKMEECSSAFVNRTTVENITYRAGCEERETVALRDVAELVNFHSDISLMNINAEGAEFEIIERLLSSQAITLVRYLQVEFHKFRADAKRREAVIDACLRSTHDLKFATAEGWSAWRRKK